jgi:hypothetical protein
MTTALKSPGLALAIAPITFALLLAGGNARADIKISIQQVGADVVASAAGKIDLTGLTFQGISNNSPEIVPTTGFVVMGTTPGPLPNDIYSGITGPSSFGVAVPNNPNPSFGSGDVTLLSGTAHLIGLPVGYASGDSVTSTDTWSNQTIAGLDLTPGTYTYTWGTGGLSHTLTVQIGPSGVPAVPEPSTAVVAVFGAVTFLAYGWSRHRREHRRRAAA